MASIKLHLTILFLLEVQVKVYSLQNIKIYMFRILDTYFYNCKMYNFSSFTWNSRTISKKCLLIYVFFSSNKSRKTTFKNISYCTIYVFVFPLDEIRGVRRDDRINIIICIHSVLRDNIIHAISAEQLFFPTVSFSFIIILLFDRRLSDTYHIKVSNCNVF